MLVAISGTGKQQLSTLMDISILQSAINKDNIGPHHSDRATTEQEFSCKSWTPIVHVCVLKESMNYAQSQFLQQGKFVPPQPLLILYTDFVSGGFVTILNCCDLHMYLRYTNYRKKEMNTLLSSPKDILKLHY